MNSGQIFWTYQAQQLSLVAATSDGGVALWDGQNKNIMHLDSQGVLVPTVSPSSYAPPTYSWSQRWYGVDSFGATIEFELPIINTGSLWATPGGNGSQSGFAAALCYCLVESSDAEAPVVAPSQAVTSQNCPLCYLPAPNPGSTQNSCITSSGTASAYVILVGDPGLPGHNVLDLFALAAQTQFNILKQQNHSVAACRVSLIQDVYRALTQNGYIDGGVIYFGHSGLRGPFPGVPKLYSSEIFIGENSGSDTNIASFNVSYLSGIQTANFNHNFIDQSATITINGCEAGKTVFDFYAQKDLSIAELLAKNLNRTVYAYEVGMYFGTTDAQHDKWVTGVDATGKPRKVPDVLPMYMIPEGAPGNKPLPLICRPNAGHCTKQ